MHPKKSRLGTLKKKKVLQGVILQFIVQLDKVSIYYFETEYITFDLSVGLVVSIPHSHIAEYTHIVFDSSQILLLIVCY